MSVSLPSPVIPGPDHWVGRFSCDRLLGEHWLAGILGLDVAVAASASAASELSRTLALAY